MYQTIRKNILLNTILLLVLGAVSGTVLLTLVFCIPVDRMLSGYQSVGMQSLERRDGWHRYLVDYEASTLDNNTECLMMKVAATPLPPTGENILQKALRCYTLNNEWNHGLTFMQYEWKGQALSCDSYERYWHGYAVLLKPLMFFFSYTDIVFLNIVFQILLIGYILYLFRKKDLPQLQLPFLILQVVSMQPIIALCLDYSVCFYIYAAALLLLLCRPNLAVRYPSFFLTIGMITAYMDLLTWPLVTLMVPLTVFLSMHKQDSVLRVLRTLSVSTLFWGIGYIGQWASKWMIATIFLDDNIIMDAVRQFGLRSSAEIIETGETVSWPDVIQRNLSVFDKNGYKVLFALIVIWLAVPFIKNLKTANRVQLRKNMQRIVPCLLVALYPFFWYLITKNHSFSHCWMTWRILAASVFAVCCLPAALKDRCPDTFCCTSLQS